MVTNFVKGVRGAGADDFFYLSSVINQSYNACFITLEITINHAIGEGQVKLCEFDAGLKPVKVIAASVDTAGTGEQTLLTTCNFIIRDDSLYAKEGGQGWFEEDEAGSAVPLGSKLTIVILTE